MLVVAELQGSKDLTHIYPHPGRWQRSAVEWGEGLSRVPSSSPSTSSQAWHQELSQSYQSKPPSPPLHHPGSSPGSYCRETRLAPFPLISTSIYDIDVSSYGLFHLAKSFSSTTLTPLKTIYCRSSFLSLFDSLSLPLSLVYLPEATAPDLALLEVLSSPYHYPCFPLLPPPSETIYHLLLNGLPNLPDSEASLIITLVIEVELQLQAQCGHLPLVLLVTGR